VKPLSTVLFLICALLLSAAVSLEAASIGGIVFEDRDRDGIFDPGESPLRNARVQLLGLDGTVFLRVRTELDGSWLFSGLADGDYVVSIEPRGFRHSLPDPTAVPAPIPDFPFGSPRYSSIENLVTLLRTGGGFEHVGLGDSIGFGFNVCGSLLGEDGYFEPTSSRLAGAAAPPLTADKQSIPGHETSDLLDPGISSDFPFTNNDIFYAVDNSADWVSISIGGNDFLGAEDGGDPEVAAALVTARRNLQEILSSLVSELPEAAIELNTVYDNEEGADGLHNVWVPIWNQVVREAAWAQERPVRLAEIYPEYRHDAGGALLGEPGLICNDFLGLDGIHPTNSGYDVHEQKLWQSIGGISLSGADRLDVVIGYQRPRRLLSPLEFEETAGDTINPEDALDSDDQGALVPSDNAEFRVEVFLNNPPGALELQHAILKVRYRTTGAPIDDFYRFEASLDGSFTPPGSTPTTWNTILPIVGATGNSGSEILAYPDQPGFRTVAAPLYVGAPTSNNGTLDWTDLQSLSVRLVTTAVGTPDGFSVEWDAAWVEAFAGPAGATRSAGREVVAETTAIHPISRPREETSQLLAELDSIPLARRTLAELAHRPEATPELIELLRADDPQLRARAARLLGRIESSSEWLLPALRQTLSDDNPAVRAAAATALAERGDGSSAPDIAALRHEPGLAFTVAEALSILDRPETSGVLLEMALAADLPDSARRRAARGLAASRQTQAVEHLQRLRQHPDPRIRRLAAAGLDRSN
jgi:hypothetical protein